MSERPARSEHISVLLQEAVAALNIRPDGLYIDATFGRGGHSRAILQNLGPRGRLIALDKDPAAVENAKNISDKRFSILHAGFSSLQTALHKLGIKSADGILLDLGVSSPQIDDAARGFSFRFDAPLDMRMDTSRGLTAAEWLATAEESEIKGVIKEYGEERFAGQIARKIVATRGGRPLTTTRELAALVANTVRTREPGQDPATRTFQAIRIHINQELEELSLVLPQTLELLNIGGRLAVISFHSLEDRIVKRFMQSAAKSDHLPSRLPVRAAEVASARFELIGRAIKASDTEISANPRSRSAVLRVAEKLI
ncbi:MAG: 16S rRNA (cytosine(1402)-N(4))-methyltransferase RsmH [Burkholderiales bacterium]